jgi:hypothetical protein
MRLRLWGAAGVLLVTLVGGAQSAETASQLDRLLAQENAGRKVKEAPTVDDLGFLRRVFLDIVGRIPSEKEIQQFLALPAKDRRAKVIDDLIGREQFPDRWAVFLSDMFRIRATTDGGAAFQAWIHRALETNRPYDVVCRELISASGKANMIPEVGFVLGDDADPMALAGVTSQVFLGVRMACAQCHDHPFDTWTRKQFYDLAAYFGKTRRQETRIKMRLLGVYLTEVEQTSILWPPEDKAKGKTRSPVKATFPFTLDREDGPSKHVARLLALREKQAAEAKAKGKKKDDLEDLIGAADDKLKGKKKDDIEITDDKKKLNVDADIYKASALRAELAKRVTDPRNRFFARNIVNRVWGELLGRGFVNPVDDFKEDNPPSHPKALDYLAEEFVANGYDFRWLVRTIVSTQAYQRGHLPQSTDAVTLRESQQAFVAATTRRMISESLYDSIVQAGHLFNLKHKPGDNLVTLTRVVQEYVEVKDDKDPKSVKPKDLGKKDGGKVAAMPRQAMPSGGYDLERGIEVDFKSALMKRDDVKLDQMEVKSNEQLEAESMMMTRPDGKKVKLVVREVKQTIDDNPRFTSSMRMASPAPVGHFLRIFGQTDRSTLDERRDNSPSMRQALMMLNGRLTNEAARVGALEPMHALLAGPKSDVDSAIKLAYREALTREPSAEEMDEARKVVQGAKDVLEGMADLRWALLNSNAFRYLP